MADAAASALAWWQEAGVDTVVGEAPRDWLAAPPQPLPAAAPDAPAAGEEVLPATLASFQAWLTSAEALPLGAPAAPRVGPSGHSGGSAASRPAGGRRRAGRIPGSAGSRRSRGTG